MYVVLGSEGQLGREIVAALPKEEGIALTRADADLSIHGQITAALQRLRQGHSFLVINTAAYNFVDSAEDDPKSAFAVNALGVRELALACRDLQLSLVHFSTDYVFGMDEYRSHPYRESDSPGPVSTYGLSKLTGEYFVRAYCPQHFVIRTCGLYGRHGVGGKGTNFVETMLKLAGQGKPIRVVDDQTLTPSSAADVAEIALRLVKSYPFGLYHLTNAGQCTWFEFAKAIFELAKVAADVQPISSAAYGNKARRPGYSVLASEHPDAPCLRPWRDALQDYLRRR